jgi:hypothetical protein
MYFQLSKRAPSFRPSDVQPVSPDRPHRMQARAPPLSPILKGTSRQRTPIPGTVLLSFKKLIFCFSTVINVILDKYY